MQLIQYDAGDRDGAEAAAADLPALDQQVLHPRPQPGEILHQLVRRPGPHRVRHLLGQSRTSGTAPRASRTTSRGPARTPSTRSSRRPARARSTPSAIASAARCSRSRSPTWRRKGDDAHRSATFFATQVDFTYAGDLKVFVDEEQVAGARARDGRARLSRRHEDGDRLQHAALQRPDLALRRQQLPARQGAAAVRPALLEFGCDAHAGGQPLVLSAQLLSREQAVARAR